jgi:hypothetical protein
MKDIGSPTVVNLETSAGRMWSYACRVFREIPQPPDPLAQDALNMLDLMLHDPDLREFAMHLKRNG